MSFRCVVVVIRSGTVLLARRAGRTDWEFPAGDAGPGESPADAASRILREDFGVAGRPGTELARVGDAVAVLVTGFEGALSPKRHEAVAWSEGRRVLERELSADARPIAEIVASHRRRDRYQGTHPKEFGQKYKELSGDAEAMAKAAARGSTPAGAHLSIMVPEILEALAPLPGAVVLDCTLGWGGHAAALARGGASVIGLDRDGEELERTRARLASEGVRLTALRGDYADAPRLIKEAGVGPVDGLLADLGVSSMQLDRPERGMSFKNDGPLDMRMDRSRGVTAAQWLATASEAEIAEALTKYGDEPDAAAIAARLRALAAEGRAPKTTFELASVVSAAKGFGEGRFRKTDASAKHPAVRVFQALRIAVNDERASLKRLLESLPVLLRSGGRLALLTFHSGEEALVRAALSSQSGSWRGVSDPPRRPSPDEIRLNPRARSARLWTATRA